MDGAFQVHRLNENGMEKAQKIAQAFDTLLDELHTHCHDGREFALVKTKLEEACFFAKKSMANHPANHQQDTVPA
jgi:hypothetical protein